MKNEVKKVEQKSTAKKKTVEKKKPQTKKKIVMKPNYYRLVLKGDYFAIEQYLRYIEKLDWQLYWTNLDYQVLQYPTAKAVVNFYTSSVHNE